MKPVNRRRRPHFTRRVIAGVVFTSSCLTSGLAQRATPPAQPAATSANAEVVTLDTFQVTGAALRSQEAVSSRREALTVVEALIQDDLGDLADENLAEAMIRLPGVSMMQTLYGEQEASYVSTRGIPPDLNFFSFDGIAMFSTANDGDGLRRVDLNLIPTQVSRTTSVFKTFTANLDAGAIGGVTNIEPYSALNGRETGYISAQLTHQTGESKYVPGVNSRGHYEDRPWGAGGKGLWVKRFGARDQFGVVLSGVYRQKNYDYTKRNPNGIVYYTAAGTAATADLSNWDGQHPFPTLIRPMDYTHYTETYGGSAQFEYRLSDTWQASVMGFSYKQVEDQTLNQFYVETFTGLTRPSAEEGRFRIGRTRPSFSYDRFEQKTRGLIVKAVGKLSSNSALEFRAGRYANQFYDLDLTSIYAYNPTTSFITFDMSDMVDKISIENYDPLTNLSNYRMMSAADNEVRAKVISTQARIDFTKNYRTYSTGFGYSLGADVRETEARRDSTTITYTSNNSVLGDLGFVPDFISKNYGYPVVWIDYDRFESSVKPTLAINRNNSNNNSWLEDYFYEERVMAAYVSVKYGAERTQYIGGIRFDKVDFDALSPLDTTGIFDGTFSAFGGGYDHVLPAISVAHSLRPGLRVKAGISRSLGRPQFGDIAQAERRNDEALTLSRGNRSLKPRRADNYDVTLEYFFAGSGLVSLGAFQKDIKDDIYTSTVDETIDGVTWAVRTPRNNSASTMRGVEFQIVHDAIPGLPGPLEKRLGVSLNFTRFWGEMDYLSGTTFVHLDSLQYQPEWLANATVFYKLPRKGEFRASYHRQGRAPISLGAYPWTTYWLNPKGQLDMALRYSITDRFITKFQIGNVTNEGISQGYITPYPMNRYEMTRNRTFTLDLIYKF